MIAHALDSLLNLGGVSQQVSGAWPAGTRLLRTARGTLRVRDTGGSGPVVVIVPDGPNVIEHHEPVISRLAPHARVICFDMPGFGYSRPPFGYAHTLEQGAQTVLAVMDALNVHEASLFFSCGNGFYAMAAAKLAPQRIRRLLLCQTPGLQSMPAWMLRNMPPPIRTPVVGQVLARAARRKLAHTWYGMAMPDKPQRSEFRALANHALTHGGCFCLAGVVQGLSRATEPELSGVKQPTMLLWGDADRSHKHTRAETLLDLLPQANVIHFPECGHFPDLEQPQRYTELALAALGA
ncbi:MAG: alpha/beta fold hydrolase [Nevskiales bacterium]